MLKKYLNIIKEFIIRIYQDIKNFNPGILNYINNINYNLNKNNASKVKNNNQTTPIECKVKKVTIKRKTN